MFTDFVPKEHAGRELYELQDIEIDNILVTLAVSSDVSFEQAKKTPWYFLVREEEKDVGKKAEPIKPTGKPLRRWGRRNVPITREDVAKAVAEWDTDVPKQARGLLMAETLTEEEEEKLM